MRLIQKTDPVDTRDHAVFVHASKVAPQMTDTMTTTLKVRRVKHPEHGPETQIETQLKQSRPSWSRATYTSICMPPGDAVRFAAKVAPEFAALVREMVLGDGTAECLQRSLDMANALLKQMNGEA